MAKDPAILFYTADFLTGTAYFTDEQRGQYIRLLCEQHQVGHIPEQHMINICKTYDSPVLKKFIKDDDGNYFNERMETEVEKRKSYSESRRNNRMAKAEKKDMNKHMSNHMSVHMENENINENINVDIIELYKGIEIFFDEDCRPKTEKQIQDWYDTLDKLIRIDGHSPEHIHDVIKRARMDDFWRQNFLSVLKLRKKNKEGITYFTVFEKKLNYGTTKTIGADPGELAALTARKLGIE